MDYETEYGADAEYGPRKRSCFVVIGWMAFAILVIFVAIFAYKFKFYYEKLSAGESVRIPQFTGSITVGETSSDGVMPLIETSLLDSGDQPTLGIDGAGAQLTIVEFADYECPFCREVHPTVRRLMTMYGDRVRYVYRDYPVKELHPESRRTSLAAECAREQGMFWAYHDKLYQNQASLSLASLITLAGETGMDQARFETCLIEERHAEAVDFDIAEAERFKIRGTPTFFFNGYRIEGAIPAVEFEEIMKQFLE